MCGHFPPRADRSHSVFRVMTGQRIPQGYFSMSRAEPPFLTSKFYLYITTVQSESLACKIGVLHIYNRYTVI